jgi:hypothetical protein
MRATAEIVALRAARNLQVEKFRRNRLSNGLIGMDDVSAWIEDSYRAHLPSQWPADRGPWEATNSTTSFYGWQRPHAVLEWIDEVAGTTKLWCVPPRTPLAELATISEKMASQWDWNRGYATTFVLTGSTPPRPGIRHLSFKSRRGFDDRYGPFDYLWVRAHIDVEVTPEELAGWWRGVREHLGASGRHPLGEKAVELARFALSRDESTSTRIDMQDWNAQVRDEWQFTDWRNYRTSARRAIDRLNRPAADLQI